MSAVKRMENLLSSVLRTGVLLSGALILIGLALTVLTGDMSYPNGDMSLSWIIWGDPFLTPSHILFLGFLTLIATPVLRIVVSTIVYLKINDRAFAAITALVLVILAIGFTLGVG
jgi:uncharacterized membrane protein